MQLTDEQRHVVDRRSDTLLVAAGAGTGKTSLLVECYLRAVLDDGVDIDELPTVTFTRKAAAEMRSRVRDALLKRDRPDLARRVQQAPIGTIDSFAGSLLRCHAIEAGVDPRFTVLDEEQASIMQAEVFDSVWETYLVEVGEDRLQTLARNRWELSSGLVPLYNRMRGAGVLEPRLRLEPPPPLSGFVDALAEACRELLRLELQGNCSKTMERNLDLAEATLEWVSAVEPTEAHLRRAGELRPRAQCSEAVKPFVRAVQEALAGVRRGIGAHLLAPLASATDDLLVSFHRGYEARKGSVGVLDFTDLTLRARDLLVGGTGTLGAGSRLIVDEFQDTNELQVALFDALSADSSFAVGDALQSIYGFRGADVEVFLDRRNRFAEREGRGEAAVGTASLTRNFRSRPAVLEVVNHLFGHEAFFGSGYMPLTPGRRDDEPRPGREADRGVLEPAVELLGLVQPPPEEREDDWQTAEAAVVAERVRGLVEDEGWRRRDVVLLLPRLTKVDRYAGALLEAGLEPYVVGGRGYYGREEVTDIVCLLRVLVNPHDDFALATVLRSPLGGVSDDALVLLRRASRAAGKTFLWEGLAALAASWEGGPEGATTSTSLPEQQDFAPGDVERLLGLQDRVSRLRRRTGRQGLASFIEEVLDAFDYDLLVLGLQDGRRRYANLRKLMGLADEYESVSGPSLSGFVSYVRQRGHVSAKEGLASTIAEESDVVRIMTVHQAKGLEFPVVVVAGLGSPGKSSTGGTFLVGRDGRAALVLRDGSLRQGEERPALGPAQELLDEVATREESERLRLAYVAATRAEERLLLIGTHGLKKPNILERLWTALSLDPELEGRVRPVEGLELEVAGVPVSGLDLPGPGASPDRSPALRDRPAPPPPRVLPAPASRSPVIELSFSSLSQYRSCPRRFYLERVLGLRLESGTWPWSQQPGGAPHAGGPEGGPGDGALGRDLGSAVHRVLEWADLGAFPVGLELHALATRALGELGRTDDGLVARCAELSAGFSSSPQAAWPDIGKAEREVGFAAPLGEFTLVGYFDLLLRRGGRWLIVDYKTNRLGPGGVEEAVEPYLLQADVYAWAALAAGAEEVVVSFLFLEEPTSPFEVRFEAKDIGVLRGRLEKAVRGLSEGSFPPAEEACPDCAAWALCRAFDGGDTETAGVE